MPDKIQSSTIICQGGLDSSDNHLLLSSQKSGAASRLTNYEVGLNGGYRRLSGFSEYDSSFPEVGDGVSEGAVLGICIFFNTTTNSVEILAARKLTAGAEYKWYLYTDGVGWVAIATGITHATSGGGQTVEKIRHSKFNSGAKNVVCFTDGVNGAVLYDGSAWVEVAQASTGADFANAGGNQALDAPYLSVFFKNTLFLFDDSRNDLSGTLCHSAPAAYYNFTTASGGGQIPAGFTIVEAAAFREKLYVAGFDSIKYVEEVSGTFVIKDATTRLGCIARDSMQEIGGDLVFMSQDGIRPISGTADIGDIQLETISKQIQTAYRDIITSAALSSVNSVALRGKSQVRWFLDGDTIDVGDARGIIGGLRSSDQSTGWEYGNILGIRASCVTSDYIGNIETILHGDFDGRVYQQESGNSFNGANIISIYKTPYLDLGDTEIRKTFRKCNLFIQGEGGITLVLDASFDWGTLSATNATNYTVEIGTTSVVYGGAGVTYGDIDAIYGGVLEAYKRINIQGSAFSIALRFATSSTDASHSIHGMTLEYSVEGRL